MIPTLPGSIPGLLRRGSPVFWRDEETRYVVTGVPFHDADDALWVIAAPCAGIPLGVRDDPSNFALGLSDATGRAHAAWWLGAALNVGAATLVTFSAGSIGGRHWILVGRRFNGDFTGWTGFDVQSRAAQDSYLYHLDNLDPADPRLLPDGSRLVDALALSIIVRHVAGLDPA